MDIYNTTSYTTAQLFTENYSTSFSLACRLFAKDLQPHIYAIYGLVRLADEIVDSYQGNDAATLLAHLEEETGQAMARQYSTNPVIHAFALTAQAYGIGEELIRPFFASMFMDLRPVVYDQDEYARYIFGSAEVVGLMCLRVFCRGDQETYDRLREGAKRLGAAYQKVNFLRDLSHDYRELGRSYFPGVNVIAFDESAKRRLVAEIKADFDAARPYIGQLPADARPAVTASYRYYRALLRKLDKTPARTIAAGRVRIANRHKLVILSDVYARKQLSRLRPR